MDTRLARSVAIVIAITLTVITPRAMQAQGAGAPTNVTTVVNGDTLTLSWSAPVSGVPQHYLVYAGTTPDAVDIGTFNIGLVSSVSGSLAPGTYYLSVAAVYATGPPQVSASVAVTVGWLPAPPGVPGNLTHTIDGTTATFTWTAPSSGGAAASYLLLASLLPGELPIATLPVAVSSITIASVPAGTYYVSVVALNAGGSSAASNVVAVTVAAPQPPGAPTLNPAVVSGSSVTLNWTPGATGGPAELYVISALLAPGDSPVAQMQAVTSPLAITGVATGTYYVFVNALNAAGESPSSNLITIAVGTTMPTLTGVWRGTLIETDHRNGCVQDHAIELNLTQSGSVVSGSGVAVVGPRACGDEGESFALLVSGSVNGVTVQLLVDNPGEPSGDGHLTGTVSGNTMSGAFQTDEGDTGTWSFTRF